MYYTKPTKISISISNSIILITGCRVSKTSTRKIMLSQQNIISNVRLNRNGKSSVLFVHKFSKDKRLVHCLNLLFLFYMQQQQHQIIQSYNNILKLDLFHCKIHRRLTIFIFFYRVRGRNRSNPRIHAINILKTCSVSE